MLTHLQYLTVGLLLSGKQSGEELRESLRRHDHRISQPAFSQLMQRLVLGNLVHAKRKKSSGCSPVRFIQYRATRTGLESWLATRQFHAALADPGPGAEAHVHDDRAEAKAADRQAKKLLKRLRKLGESSGR